MLDFSSRSMFVFSPSSTRCLYFSPVPVRLFICAVFLFVSRLLSDNVSSIFSIDSIYISSACACACLYLFLVDVQLFVWKSKENYFQHGWTDDHHRKNITANERERELGSGSKVSLSSKKTSSHMSRLINRCTSDTQDESRNSFA